MREEVVRRRRWVSDEGFLDLFGAASIIPGPSSTELAIFLGYLRGGMPGLIAAGVFFIAPAMVLVGAIAWAYTRLGDLPATGWLLYGVKPAVIAIIVVAIVGLIPTALKDIPLRLIALMTLVAFLMAANPLILLVCGGLLSSILHRSHWRSSRQHSGGPALLLPLLAHASQGVESTSLISLFLAFLKIGAVAFGGGYILLPLLQADLVHSSHWLSERQILDAVAVGQVTPGPVFTTATFLGYLLAGVPGAVVATAGIFLPSFILVAILFPHVDRIRSSPWLSTIMDGVNASAVGLMAGAVLVLARDALVDIPTVVIAVSALVLLVRWRINPAWLVLGAAVAGVATRGLTG